MLGWLAGSTLIRTLAMLTVVGTLTSMDVAVQRDVQAWRRPQLEGVMRVASDAASPRNLFALMVVVAAFGGPAGPALVRSALVVLVPTNLAVEGLKRATNRTRPDGSHDRNNASFPSSHTANAIAVAMVVWRRWPRAGWLVWPLAALIAGSRLYLNRHFLSDVLVGAMIGVACSVFALRWARGPGLRWVESGRYRSR